MPLNYPGWKECMRAIRIHEYGEPKDLQLDEVPRPEPGPGEVLIRVNCAALNFPDLLKIAGKHQNKVEPPFSPGSEFAGTVEALGPGVTAFKVGQRVFARTGSGGFVEYASVPEDKVVATPDAMPDEDAAVFSLVYHTSYISLIHRGLLQPGETVLVHSAAGGVGLAAVQIARAKGAGKVIGTVGSDAKVDLVRENGADVVVNYRTEDFVEVVKRETDGRGADIIYDPVGGELTERSTKCIASEGRILIIGFTSGEFSKFRSNHILVKNYSVMGVLIGRTNATASQRCWDELLELYAQGKVKPLISERFKMEDAAAAMELLASRKAVGKILLHW